MRFAISAIAMSYLLCAACIGWAQDVAPPKPTPEPATAPAAGLTAKVIEVHGDVKAGPVTGGELKKVQVGDAFPANTKIRTGVRSSVKLQVGENEPYTALLVDSVGVVVISELLQSADSKTTRVFVEQGQVRAGVAEGALKSDFTIDCPVATLSKKGTWGIVFFYARGADTFEASLADRGLIEVINEMTREKRQLGPGQVVTQAMRSWLDESSLRRNVPVADLFGQADVTISFNRALSEGLGVTAIGEGAGGANALSFTSSSAGNNLFARPLNAGATGQIPTGSSGPILRPEGFFGTGRGDDLLRFIAGSKASAKH